MFCNTSFADDKNLPSLFGIQLSDKITNYQFFPPHTEDKYFVLISPPIKNDDFEQYTVKYSPLGMIYEITGTHKKSFPLTIPPKDRKLNDLDVMIFTREENNCIQSAIPHAKILAKSEKFKSYYSSKFEEDDQQTFFSITFSTNSDSAVHEDWKYLIAVQCQKYKPKRIRAELTLVDMGGSKFAKELEKALIDKKGLGN